MKKILIIFVVLFFLLSGFGLTFAADEKEAETLAPALESTSDKGDDEIGEIGGGGDKDEEQKYQGDGSENEVVNPNHTQRLGGKSENAYKGLNRAAQCRRSGKKAGSGSKSFKANSHPRNNDRGGRDENTEKDKPGKKDKRNNGKRNKKK